MSTPASQALNDATTQTTTTTQGTTTQAANQPTFYKDWIKPDAPDAKELTDFLGNKKFADPATLVKSYREMEREASSLRTAVNVKAYPTDTKNADGTIKKADENAVKAWNAAMGVPATPADYKLEVPVNAPYPQFTGYLSEVLHSAGVPVAMAPKLAAGYEAAVVKMETELRAAEDAKSATDLKQLESEWGSNYQERVALASRGKEWLAKEVGGLNDIQMRSMETLLGTAKFMSVMCKFGAGNKEPSFAGGGEGKSFAGGASAAQAEYDQIIADRTAGKVSNYQWSSQEMQSKIAGLVERIAAGNAH